MRLQNSLGHLLLVAVALVAASATQAAISGIAGNKEARTGDAETGIKPIFDQQKVKDEVKAQVVITGEFGKNAAKAWGEHANRKFTEALEAGNEADMACWAPDGACRAGGHALVGGLTGSAAGAASAAVTSMAAPHVHAWLVSTGVPAAAADAITQLSALGAGAALGGTAGSAAAFNEAANNTPLAIPLIAEGIAAGGAVAAAACLSSPVCLKALRMGGEAIVAKVAALLSPEELATIPGFGSSMPLSPAAPTITPADARRIYGAPPLQDPQGLRAWLGDALDGYPADEAQRWAKDFINTLPASTQRSLGDFIMLSVQDNAVAGSRREQQVAADLQLQYPGGSVQNQQYLRDKDGNIVIDPNTGTARRLDHIVVINGRIVEVVETTSLTAEKERQMLHEQQVRAEGGRFIRERNTGELLEVPSLSRIERRP